MNLKPEDGYEMGYMQVSIFRTITGSDWRDALRRARGLRNPVSCQIRRIVAQMIARGTIIINQPRKI